MKILICFGTRPEAIKMAPVIIALKKNNIPCSICVTGQHREMLDQVLNFFQIKADYDLNLMEPNQTLNGLSSKLLLKIDPVLEKEKPMLVLVQGDTTTAAVVSLAAFNSGVKVGHIEAGLRTYNKRAPFPEEMNRQIISRIADYHFTPTNEAKDRLLEEHLPEEQIFVTGNTVVDALLWGVKKVKSDTRNQEIQEIRSLLKPPKKMILVTGHRRENFGKGLEEICEAIVELSMREDVELVYPVHFNPNVSEPVYKLLGGRKNIHLISPVSYPTMIWLMRHSDLIISDSGGIQEEAPTFKKSVLVTRESSERMEGIKAGFSFLVGTDKARILQKANELLLNPRDLSRIENPYGDGRAAKKIVAIIQKI